MVFECISINNQRNLEEHKHNIIIIPAFIQICQNGKKIIRPKIRINYSRLSISCITKIIFLLFHQLQICYHKFNQFSIFLYYIFIYLIHQVRTKVVMYRENLQQNHVTTIQNNLSPQIGQTNGEKIKASEQNNQENQNIQTIQEKIWRMLDLSKHIFKRKVILMILTIILALSSFIFTIILATKGTSFLQSLLNIEIKTQSLICAIAILIVAGIFCTIIYRGNILMLHCYWIICLFFFIIFVIVASNAYSVTNQDCESPTSYIFQRLKLFNINSKSLFCTQNCPCSNSITNKNNNSTYFSVIQECPGWTDTFYSSFFKTLQSSLSCSGWCKINPNRYYMFTQQNTTTLNVQQIPCFIAFKNSLQNSSLSIKVIGIFQCTLLILIILYTNYYIFMQKQDEERQKKRLKKQLKEAKQRLQGQLKTSKRLLQ